VTVIDGASNQALRTIGVGSCPIDFCHNPCQNRTYVANSYDSSISVLRDSGGGIEEMANEEVRMTNGGATIVRGVLNLQPARYNRQSEICLLDAAGRKVLDLKPGANDVRQLAPGVYFVRMAAGVQKKVIIQ